MYLPHFLFTIHKILAHSHIFLHFIQWTILLQVVYTPSLTLPTSNAFCSRIFLLCDFNHREKTISDNEIGGSARHNYYGCYHISGGRCWVTAKYSSPGPVLIRYDGLVALSGDPKLFRYLIRAGPAVNDTCWACKGYLVKTCNYSIWQRETLQLKLSLCLWDVMWLTVKRHKGNWCRKMWKGVSPIFHHAHLSIRPCTTLY